MKNEQEWVFQPQSKSNLYEEINLKALKNSRVHVFQIARKILYTKENLSGVNTNSVKSMQEKFQELSSYYCFLSKHNLKI